MDYTSIHIYGHLLSDDILHEIETDSSMLGNREQDFNLDVSLTAKIDIAWSSLRNDWKLFAERNLLRDSYGTKSVRRLMERFFASLDYQLNYQQAQVEAGERKFDIPYLCPDIADMPVIIVGDKTGDINLDTLDKCTLDIRQKGERRQKSPHATMLDYLNSTEHVYGIVTNGQVLRVIRNTGQLVKLTYIEFDFRRMVEEDHYAEFNLMFRLMHSSRFMHNGDDACIMEQWFNRSIESGNRIRAGLSDAVQRTMEILGRAVVSGEGEGNDAFRQIVIDGKEDAQTLNKELIHFIYRLLFLFIIEDRNLVYNLNESEADYDQKVRCQDIYKKYYAVSRLRGLSELLHLRNARYHDLWEGLMDSFRLFENEEFGKNLCIKPLGGVLFAPTTLKYLRQCRIDNKTLLEAFSCLNEFKDEKQNRVKINYSSLDVEEFGSVYEGILEMRPFINQGTSLTGWDFGYVGGLDRKSTSSYYTRPDLVQNLIRTTLEPVIKERIAKLGNMDGAEKAKDLLNMKVCDAASGSGHIVLAMARTIAWYVCTLRTGEDNPASLDYREALREVIQRCVYAVDYNPDAVELCKVVLWIEGYCAGKPLSFLDHHVRCGNSVVGVTDLDAILNGVPKEAFSAEDNDTKRKIISLNRDALRDVELVQSGQRGQTISLFTQDFTIQNIDSEQIGLASQVSSINSLPENSLLEQLTKQRRWEDLMQSPRVECLRRACDIYTYAFYKQFKSSDLESSVDETGTFTAFNIPYTRTVFQALQEIKYLDDTDGIPDAQRLPDTFRKELFDAAAEHRFFHWCIEFPEVFAGHSGGFDVMCGNPPWDKIKVEDKKWFENQGRPDIVNAGTAAQRKRAIANLPQTDPELFAAYQVAQQNAESLSRFVRFGGRFPLTATGDIDLYPLFAEHCLNCSSEAWGLVMPTGIAINDSNKTFFSRLIDENRLISLYDFENKEGLFDIHRMFKFCLLTAGKAQQKSHDISGGFFLTRLDHLLDPNRIYTLNTDDFKLLNPNTKTCPIFRTSRDAILTAKIYRHSQILINEVTGINPWGIKTGSMIHMSGDSYFFRTYSQLTEEGAIYQDENFLLGSEIYVPLYEGKMIWHYNHLYGEWPTDGERPNAIPSPSIEEWQNPNYHLVPWYWVPMSEVDNKLIKTDRDGNIIWEWKHNYLLGFRDVTNATNERTMVPSLIPTPRGVGNSTTLLYVEGAVANTLVLATLSSLPLDYVAKQKVGGSHASISFVKQFPVLGPDQISESSKWEIVKRVAELCYFNHDLDGWATELYEELPEEQKAEQPRLGNLEPYVYDTDRRAVLQAELDAIFSHLYGLTTEELRYILDPEDICGQGCINETFRVLKDNEIRQFGEYRTKRLVLDAWNRFGYSSKSSF